MIQDRLWVTQSRQQIYADHRFCSLNFGIGDRVFLYVLSRKGLMRFGKRDKFSPRYVGHFVILRTIGGIA